MKLVLPEKMKEIDKKTIEELGVPSLLLMESAAAAVELQVLSFSPRKILLLCGRGNNGGDAYAAGRKLLARGLEVSALSLGMPVTKEARLNYRLFKAFGGKVYKYTELTKKTRSFISEHDLILDGLFGVGFKGSLSAEMIDLIEYVNALSAIKVAVDIPSGVDGTNGSINPIAFKANVTVTFGAGKPGHFFFPGCVYTGTLHIARIGFPERLVEDLSNIELVDDQLAKALLPERIPWGHKGTFGKVCIVGGSSDYTGAALLAALGSMKIGAGIVYTFTPREAQEIVRNNLPEAICIASKSVVLTPEDVDALIALLDKVDALVVGPGIGRADETIDFVKELLSSKRLKSLGAVIVDADALYAVSRVPETIKRKGNFILTPHPGEFSRLTKKPIEEVVNNMDTVKSFAMEMELQLTLKGAVSIIADKSGGIWLNNTGNTGLAKGGSGDLLSGTIAGLSAQGLAPLEALVLGSYFMGKAAELTDKYEATLSASAIAANYGKVFEYLKAYESDSRDKRYN